MSKKTCNQPPEGVFPPPAPPAPPRKRLKDIRFGDREVEIMERLIKGSLAGDE